MYSNDPTDLSYPLLYFTDDQRDAWTLSDAVRATQIYGGIGSGKTSGSGRMIATSFLKAGYGGLVLCGKTDEKDNWLSYLRETGRQDDVLIFSEANKFRFNFLDYEMKREGGGHTRNIVNLFTTIAEMGQKRRGGGGSSDPFWEDALKRLLYRVVDLIKLSGQDLTVPTMYEIVTSAPRSIEDTFSDEFIKNSHCMKSLIVAKERSAENPSDYQLLEAYFMREIPRLDERTTSNIFESFFGLVEPFLTGLLKELFSGESNIKPELTQEGFVIILDIPVQQYRELGTYSQIIFKLLWQQAMERRNVQENPLPCFLAMDESQLFLTQEDQLWITTARSSRVCPLLMTQNINNYYVAIGGSQPIKQTNSLLGNLNTKIFHGQSDIDTNNFASDSIAKTFQNITSVNTGMSGEHTSAGAQSQLHHQVHPVQFTTLKTGGALHNYEVEGFVTVVGRTWSNGKNHLKVSFSQRGH